MGQQLSTHDKGARPADSLLLRRPAANRPAKAAGPGRSIEGKRRLDFRQLQPRRLLCLDLLDMQIVEGIGQLFFIRQSRTQFRLARQ